VHRPSRRRGPVRRPSELQGSGVGDRPAGERGVGHPVRLGAEVAVRQRQVALRGRRSAGPASGPHRRRRAVRVPYRERRVGDRRGARATVRCRWPGRWRGAGLWAAAGAASDDPLLDGAVPGFATGAGLGAESAEPADCLALSGFGAAAPPEEPESLGPLDADLGFGAGPPPPEPLPGPPATPVSGFSRATGCTVVTRGPGGEVRPSTVSTRAVASRNADTGVPRRSWPSTPSRDGLGVARVRRRRAAVASTSLRMIGMVRGRPTRRGGLINRHPIE
jgi:hypothetical protein